MIAAVEVSLHRFQTSIEDLRHEGMDEVTAWLKEAVVSHPTLIGILESEILELSRQGYFSCLLLALKPPGDSEVKGFMEHVHSVLWQRFQRFVPIKSQMYIEKDRAFFFVNNGGQEDYDAAFKNKKKTSTRGFVSLVRNISTKGN